MTEEEPKPRERERERECFVQEGQTQRALTPPLSYTPTYDNLNPVVNPKPYHDSVTEEEPKPRPNASCAET